MATWIDPVDSQTDPDAPITSDLAKRWDNNVIALSEGAAGAPRLAPGAMAGSFVGSVSRGNSSAPLGINDIGDFEQIGLSIVGLTGTSGSGIQISFSTDNGVTYGSYQTLLPQGSSFSSECAVISKTDQMIHFSGDPVINSSRSLIIPNGANAFQLRNTVSSPSYYFSALVFLLGGRS